MSPTIAWREGEVVALGSPGGAHIPTTTLQVLLNLAVDGDDLEHAVGRPRVHHQWQPDRLAYEAGALSAAAAADLEHRGHTLRPARKLGEVPAVQRLRDGTIVAVADPRGPGATAAAGDPGPGGAGRAKN